MKILIACEYSGIVRSAFEQRGHDVTSCDFLDTELPGKHYKGDVLDILNDGWEMMIAFPPCTYLLCAQVHLLKKDIIRNQKSLEALEFFKTLLWSKIPKIAIENPRGLIGTHIKKPDQIIHPYMFGDPYQKNICLWLKNLLPLQIPPKSQWSMERKKVANHVNGRMTNAEKSKIKSRFFHRTAHAMAEQWG